MKKLHKKAIVAKYIVALILGLVVLGFILWIIIKSQKESLSLLETIKSYF